MKLTRRVLLGAAASFPLAKACFAGQQSWPGALVMGTGQPGGTFALFGPSWGRLIKKATNVEVVYASTGGSRSNLLMIEEGNAQLGLCSLMVAIQAYNGTNSWTAGAELRQFRVLFPAFPSVLQIVATAAGPATLAGLAGRKIGVGPVGVGDPTLMETIFSSLNIVPGHIEGGDYTQQIGQLLKGELDVCAFWGAPPNAAIKAVAARNRLRLIGLSEDQASQVSKFVPGLSRMILAAGTFPGQTVDVGSVGTPVIAIGTASLPDDLVKAMTLAALQDRSTLAAKVPTALQKTLLHEIHEAGLPFHPGSIAALRQLGYG